MIVKNLKADELEAIERVMKKYISSMKKGDFIEARSQAQILEHTAFVHDVVWQAGYSKRMKQTA